jgi:hypothetical protein
MGAEAHTPHPFSHTLTAPAVRTPHFPYPQAVANSCRKKKKQCKPQQSLDQKPSLIGIRDLQDTAGPTTAAAAAAVAAAAALLLSWPELSGWVCVAGSTYKQNDSSIAHEFISQHPHAMTKVTISTAQHSMTVTCDGH